MATKDYCSIQQRVCEPIVNRGLESLRRIHFFRALKEPCLKMIATKLQVCFLAPEEVLAREGEKVDKLWFMGKGTADAVVKGQKVHTYLARSVIGPPMALLMDQIWSQTVTTTSFSDFMVLTRQDLHIFLAHHESEAVKVHAAAFHSQIKNDADPSGTPMERPQRKLKPQTKSMRSRSMSGLDQKAPPMVHQPSAALMNDQHFVNNEEFEVTRNAIASWLDGIEFFSSFDVFSLEQLLQIVRRNTYKPFQDIMTQGKLAEAFHVIYAGQVDVIIDGKVISRLGTQSLLGERSICSLGDVIKPCAATIRPVTSVVITYSWPRPSLLELFIKDDRMYETFKKKFDVLMVNKASFRNIRMFQKASFDFIDQLEEMVKHWDLQPGDVLLEGGKPNPDAYILCDGSVEILKDEKEMHQIEVTKIEDAVLFGEFNVLGLWRSPKATVRATSNCVVKILTTSALRSCLTAFPDESLIFRDLVEKRIEKDACKEIPWTVDPEEQREELSREEVSLLPRNYVRLFTKDGDTIQLPRDLGEIGEFQDLSPEPLEELSKLMKLRLYVPQQVILQQGDDLYEIVILQRGTCSANAFGADLQPMEGPCIVGGIASMMTKKVFTTIVAEETCFVGAICKHRFAAIMDKYPDFRRELLLQTNISFKRLCDDFHESMMKVSALRSHLSRVEILSDASSDFISQVASCMEPCLLLPGQSLVQDSDNPKLYFIIDGHLHVMKNGFLVAALSSKSITGILELYGIDTGDAIEVKTDEICKVGTISRTALFRLFETFPAERAKFEQYLHTVLDDQVGRRLLKHPIFSGMPSQCLKRVTLLLERKVSHPQSLIFEEGEVGSSMVVFNVGKADILFRGTQVSMLWAGKSFGAAQMMGVVQHYHATVRTKTMCHVLMLTQQRFSSLTSPGQKRPWIDTLKQRARMAYQQELRLFRQKYTHLRLLGQSGMTSDISSAIYSKIVLLQQVMKSWSQLVTHDEVEASEVASRRSSIAPEVEALQEAPASPRPSVVSVLPQCCLPPVTRAPPAPLYPLLFSRALRPIRLVLVPPGKDKAKKAVRAVEFGAN